MFKKIAIGFLAVAATSAMALSLPSAASASPASHTDDDYSDYWGYDYAQYHLAKAKGYVSVESDDDDSNSAYVSGKLYDLDNRSYDEGGKCAYVKFQAEDFDDNWSTVYTKRYCGYPGYKKFHFSTDDVQTLRVKVCQITPSGSYVNKCGHWDEIYTAE